ncbi:YggT family protein [Yunchengibacter salinarum]|uniref:YggT family protein n=1 Tax=Yunchengibacter salinarum TaxID=3133399 RepID=UPI0035B6336A
MQAVVWLINTLFDIVFFIVIAHVIMSWLIAFNVLNLHQPFVRMVGQSLNSLLEPMLAPIRNLLPMMGGLDLSPLVLILLVQFLRILFNTEIVPVLLGV